MNDGTRPLTEEERRLVLWMIEHGNAEAAPFLSQVEQLEVSTERCPCGCATLFFRLKGHPPPPSGVHILSDGEFGEGANLAGIFLYESGGMLSGLEVYVMGGNNPLTLPHPDDVRLYGGAAAG
jgi:hypothetical protein